MIDFTKYTLQELRAIGAVMDDLMREDAKLESWKFAAYVRSTAREAFRAESAAIDQQAKESKILHTYSRAVAAEREAAVDSIERELKRQAQQAREAADPPAAPDPPAGEALVDMKELEYQEQAAPPDMFGWVGDALDDLCAAGEVLGSNE